MTGATSVRLNVTDLVSVPVPLVADTVTTVDSPVVGVPEMTPVLVSNVNPSGSVVELKLAGELVAIIV